jgi:hypothetical protein
VSLSRATGPPDETALGRLRAPRRRAVNRSQYPDEPVPESLAQTVTSTAEGWGFTLGVVTDHGVNRRLAGMVTRAGTMKLAHSPTGAELYALTRYTGPAAARARDGLDIAGTDLALSLHIRRELVVQSRDDELVDPFRRVDVLQPVQPDVASRDTGIQARFNELASGFGQHDLAAVRRGGDARRPVDVQADESVLVTDRP